MSIRLRNRGKSLPKAVALGLASWMLGGPPARAFDDGPAQPAPKKAKAGKALLGGHRNEARGTLGYGPPGPQPGFQGFGLGYHRGYGYGGAGLGVGAEGGYPFYGGPGYPHPAPCLRRLGPVAPFPYFGAEGQPNAFEGLGGLAPDEPVVTFEGGPGSDFGPYSGAIPYPETTFAPASSGDGEAPKPDRTGSAAPVGPATAPRPTPGIFEYAALGIEAEPIASPGRPRGLKVSRVHLGGPADRAGLSVGDVIRSANGFATEEPGHLAWIIANASPDKPLKLTFTASKDGAERILTAQRP